MSAKSASPNSSNVRLILKATTGKFPITKRGMLLRIILQVSLIPTRRNRPKPEQLHGIATEPTSTCKSHSHNPQQALLKQVDRKDIEHSSTWKRYVQQPQQASCYQIQNNNTGHSSICT
jgi:hypothetical protein